MTGPLEAFRIGPLPVYWYGIIIVTAVFLASYVAAFEANEAGLHPAFGRAKGRQPGLGQAEQRKILGQLAMKEFGGVFTFHADDAKMV